MAYVGSCRFCDGNTLNADIHSECRVAELEDLIYRLQQELHGDGINFIPMLEEVMGWECLSKAQFQENQYKKSMMELHKRSDDMLRHQLMSEAASKAGDEFNKQRSQNKSGDGGGDYP